MVYLTCTTDNHHKFWQIDVHGCETVVKYGRIDTAGRVSKKTHKTHDAAVKYMEKQVKSKIKKGYVDPAENESDGAEAQPEEQAAKAAPQASAGSSEPIRWGEHGGHGDCHDGLVFVKGGARETCGVRSEKPLPKDMVWTVRFSVLGSHQAVGVATKDAPLSMAGYHYVFGDETEEGASLSSRLPRGSSGVREHKSPQVIIRALASPHGLLHE